MSLEHPSHQQGERLVERILTPEELGDKVAEWKGKFVLAQNTGTCPYTLEEQREEARCFEQAKKAGLLQGWDRKRFRSVLFPHTAEAIRSNYYKEIRWTSDHESDNDLLEHIQKIANRPPDIRTRVMRHRGPGGLIPLTALTHYKTDGTPEKEELHWEYIVEEWLNQNKKIDQPLTQNDFFDLGQRLMVAAELKPEDIELWYGAPQAGSYVITAHGPLCGSQHQHGCGAHNGNTTQAWMAALAQASMVAFATKNEKEVLIAGYRTESEENPSTFVIPGGVSGDETFQNFLESFFKGGEIPKNEEELNAAFNAHPERYYRPNEIPRIRTVFDALSAFNKMSNRKGTKYPVLISTCTDDRTGIALNKEELSNMSADAEIPDVLNKAISTSRMPEHASNIVDLPIGDVAASAFLGEDPAAAHVYRTTVARGVREFSYKSVEKWLIPQLALTAPLIINNVMSPDTNPNIYIRIVIGLESADLNNVVSRMLFDDPILRDIAKVPSIEEAPTSSLTESQRKAIIIANEKLVKDQLVEFVRNELPTKIKMSSGRRLSLNMRIAQMASKKIDQISDTSTIGRNGLQTS